MTVIVIQYLVLFHNNISLILCFTCFAEPKSRSCMQLLPFGFVPHSIIKYCVFIHFALCHISMYALRAPRQMSFGLLGSPSENKDVIIIIIIIIIIMPASSFLCWLLAMFFSFRNVHR